eukprot:5816695-Pyramimonas_sp.AAC.1
MRSVMRRRKRSRRERGRRKAATRDTFRSHCLEGPHGIRLGRLVAVLAYCEAVLGVPGGSFGHCWGPRAILSHLEASWPLER